ncbi:MAG: glutamine synthetase type III, partial [Bdellovibrionota bacterium]
ANEAPPAIISVFLGNLLDRILNEIEKGAGAEKNVEAAVLKLGVNKLPEVMKDNTDRNRTSPFAFTGNKFEFRAVGSSASTAFPITLLNAAVADGFGELVQTLKAKSKGGKVEDSVVWEVIKDAIRETKPIRFEGNNYSDDWVKEAEKRGLLNLRKTPEALAQLVTDKSREMLTRMGVFTEAEIQSRFHVRVERYVKNLAIELDTLRSMVDTQILPASFTYHGTLAQAASAAKAIGVATPQIETINKLSTLIASLQTKQNGLASMAHKVETLGSEDDKAKYFAKDVAPAMAEVRSVCDELESIVADDYWPLPKYREMLFLA